MISADEFTWDEFFWKTRTTLPAWSGFQSRRGPYGAPDSANASDGTVDVVFAPEGRGAGPLTTDELELVQWLLDHEGRLFEPLTREVLTRYPKMQESYGYDADELAEYMPNVESVDDLRQLIGLQSVNVHQLRTGGVPYLGFEFGCTWDEEHGLGVLMRGDRVVEFGGADTAILLWIAKRDAEGR